MTDNSSASSQPHVSNKFSISPVWILPLIALLIGAWMVYKDWSNRGELITITFITADGIVEDKTDIKVRNVNVGKVESVKLDIENNNVVVQARLAPETKALLKADNQFWVVKPRIGTAGVSGLGTLLSGAYIEMTPGTTGKKQRTYEGLEDPPITSASEPGLRLKLYSSKGNALSVGDNVLYRGFPVGRVEHATFDTPSRQSIYDIFIQAPYDQLVTTDTRFWNISGVNLNLSAEGLNIQTGTINTLLAGGVTFDILDENPQSSRAKSGDTFNLFPNFKSVKDRPYTFYNEYLLLFDQSIRGLVAGAPVEFRGVRIGTVESISFSMGDIISLDDPRIPVIIRIEPARLGLNDKQETLDDAHLRLRNWVSQGMRASLKSGSLLTGRLFVDFDFYEQSQDERVIEFQGYPVIPTTSGGLIQLEAKLNDVLNKIASLEVEPIISKLDKTLNTSDKAIAQLHRTLRTLDKTLKNQHLQAAPKELTETLKEIRTAAQGLTPDSQLYIELNQTLNTLQTTLQQLQPVLQTLDQKPNALIFNAPKSPDPIPGE